AGSNPSDRCGTGVRGLVAVVMFTLALQGTAINPGFSQQRRGDAGVERERGAWKVDGAFVQLPGFPAALPAWTGVC
ncbi:MAG: hypothetical protein Q9P14_12870, partial [candidate division KSB1 bacterium]|nr:hypothetical protein [candidate division KSB1 bacterium]